MKDESAPASLRSLIFNFSTPNPPQAERSLEINDLLKVPFRGFRGGRLSGVDSKINIWNVSKTDYCKELQITIIFSDVELRNLSSVSTIKGFCSRYFRTCGYRSITHQLPSVSSQFHHRCSSKEEPLHHVIFFDE